MDKKKIKHFVIENRIEELSSLAEKIENLGHDWEFPSGLTMNINLVLEEALSNIIFYAFDDKNKHEITLIFEHNKLTICITDNGIPFNPLKQDTPDINLPAEERPIGGLGIYLISQIMDEMKYSRENNQNVLTLHKSI